MTAKNAARDLLVLAELAKRVKAADIVVRQRYAEATDAGDRSVWAVGPDRTQVGVVQQVAGSVRARVSDPRALMAWVHTHRPDEIVAEPTIRASYLTVLLEAAKAAGESVDPATGEPGVPGIVVDTGPPSVRVVPAKGCAALIDEEFRAGRLAVPASVLPTDPVPAVDAEPADPNPPTA